MSWVIPTVKVTFLVDVAPERLTPPRVNKARMTIPVTTESDRRPGKDMRTSGAPSDSPPETGSVSAFRRTGIMLHTETICHGFAESRISKDP